MTGRPLGWTTWLGAPIPDRTVRPCAKTDRHTPHPSGASYWCEGVASRADAVGRLPGCPCGLTGPPLPDGSKVAEVLDDCPHHQEAG